VNDGQNPDRVELGIRFGCGAFAGLLLAFSVAIRVTEVLVVPLGISLVAGILLGWLSTRHGDRFWNTFLDILKWVRWW
jgi:hypothetical protein